MLCNEKCPLHVKFISFPSHSEGLLLCSKFAAAKVHSLCKLIITSICGGLSSLLSLSHNVDFFSKPSVRRSEANKQANRSMTLSISELFV